MVVLFSWGAVRSISNQMLGILMSTFYPNFLELYTQGYVLVPYYDKQIVPYRFMCLMCLPSNTGVGMELHTIGHGLAVELYVFLFPNSCNCNWVSPSLRQFYFECLVALELALLGLYLHPVSTYTCTKSSLHWSSCRRLWPGCLQCVGM